MVRPVMISVVETRDATKKIKLLRSTDMNTLRTTVEKIRRDMIRNRNFFFFFFFFIQRSSSTCRHKSPPYFSILLCLGLSSDNFYHVSSLHHHTIVSAGLLGLLFPVYGFNSVIFQVHLTVSIFATCPALFQFLRNTVSNTFSIFIYPLIHSLVFLSRIVIPSIALPIYVYYLQFMNRFFGKRLGFQSINQYIALKTLIFLRVVKCLFLFFRI